MKLTDLNCSLTKMIWMNVKSARILYWHIIYCLGNNTVLPALC